MALGSQFNTIIYYSDTGDIREVLPNRYIKSRRDLNSLIGMQESVGMKFFYVPGYFPIDPKDWIVKLSSGSSAPRLITKDGVNSSLVLSSREAGFILSNYKNILFEFEGGMGDYLDQADVVLEVSRSHPSKSFTVLMDASRIDALQLMRGFSNIKAVGRRDEVAGKLPTIEFNKINHLCGHYLPNGKIGAYSKISGLDAPAPRSPIMFGKHNVRDALLKINHVFSKKSGRFIVLHTMSGNTNAKSVRPDDVVDIIKPLFADKALHFLHLGGSGEEVIKHDRITSVQGLLSWKEVFALTSISKACICIDSAIMHIAQHLNIPTLSLWGPTEPLNILGRDSGVISLITSISCAGCNLYDCPHSKCMRLFNKSALRKNFKKLLKD